MTPTSADAEKNIAQRGLTLFELLIALALISLMALMATGGLGKTSPHLAVRLASEQMLADIKRARLEADASNAPVTIIVADGGYEIDALGLNRALPRGVTLALPGSPEGKAATIIIGPGHWIKAYEIMLSKGDAQSVINIEPVTRRVAVQ